MAVNKDLIIKIRQELSGKGFTELKAMMKDTQDRMKKLSDEGKRGSAQWEQYKTKAGLVKNELKGLNREFSGLEPTVKKSSSGFSNLVSSVGNIKMMFGALVASMVISKLGEAFSFATEQIKNFIDEANKLQAATLGLESIAKFKGLDTSSVKSSLQDLEIVKSGLLTIGEGSTALKNLLATNFTLEQSINLIKAFGDAAAFGRQSSLEYGYAIVSGTEGIKNSLAQLVDNMGVTKNPSMILKEAGKSMNDLQKVSTDASVRLALYNGLLKETAAFQGDAAKLTNTFAGSQQALNQQWVIAQQKLGGLAQQVLKPFLDILISLAPTFQMVLDKLIPFYSEMYNSIFQILGLSNGAKDLTTTLKSLIENGFNYLINALEIVKPHILETYKIFKKYIDDNPQFLSSIKWIIKAFIDLSVIQMRGSLVAWQYIIKAMQFFADIGKVVWGWLGKLKDAFNWTVSSALGQSIMNVLLPCWRLIKNILDALEKIGQFTPPNRGNYDDEQDIRGLNLRGKEKQNELDALKKINLGGSPPSGDSGKGSKEKEVDLFEKLLTEISNKIKLSELDNKLTVELLNTELQRLLTNQNLADTDEKRIKLKEKEIELNKKMLETHLETFDLNLLNQSMNKFRFTGGWANDKRTIEGKSNELNPSEQRKIDIQEAYSDIQNIVSTLNVGTHTFVAQLINGFNSVISIVGSIIQLFNNISSGGGIGGIFGFFKGLLSFLPGGGIAANAIEAIPMASGGFFNGKSPLLVGDNNGRITPYSELIFPNSSGYVMNNNDFTNLFSRHSNSQPVVNNVYINADLDTYLIHKDGSARYNEIKKYKRIS